MITKSKKLQKYLDKAGEKMKSISPAILMQEFMDRLHDPDMVAKRVAHSLYIE